MFGISHYFLYKHKFEFIDFQSNDCYLYLFSSMNIIMSDVCAKYLKIINLENCKVFLCVVAVAVVVDVARIYAQNKLLEFQSF